MSSMFRRPTEWTGNTYPIRSQLRSLGGEWDPQRQVWIVPAGTMRQRADMDRLSRSGGVRVTPISSDERDEASEAAAAARAQPRVHADDYDV